MTETEIKRRKAICEAAHVDEIDDVSDGFHTFRQLYYQRMMLFAAIVKQNKDKAWKSLRHEDGELCFGGGWFIVGIDTPEGNFTYHYEDNCFSLFDCEELERGKHWDGHTEKDVTRLLSLSPSQPYSCENAVSRQAAIDAIERNAYRHTYIDQIVGIINELPSAQPEPCEDAVSRKSVEDVLRGYFDGMLETDTCSPKDIYGLIELLPSVAPKRKTGRWLDNYQYGYKCSECGAYLEIDCGDVEMNFCPNCNAKMNGRE